MMRNEKGFTLIELVVVMGIFLGIMMITSYAFENILKKSGQQLKSAETQTEGLVGLEMLRSDVEHAGFGIPWTIPFLPTGGVYPEVATNPVDAIVASSFNEGTPSAVRISYTPTTSRIIDGSSNTNPNTAYLVLKSTRLPLHATAKKWAYINYSGASTNKSYLKMWNNADDFVPNERVITISSTFTTDGAPDRVLAMQDSSTYSYAMPSPIPSNYHPTNAAFSPGDASQVFVAYGVDPSSNLIMPYNRADYYIKNLQRPATCNSGTGVLYKGVVQHTGGYAEYPLLNCVGDMQVEFELDPNSNGNITYPRDLAGLTPAQIRAGLKTVRIFILAHEGKKDTSYTYPSSTIQVGDPVRPSSSGRVWDGSASCGSGANCMQHKFGADWKNYRWKVYTIAVRPKNLE